MGKKRVKESSTDSSPEKMSTDTTSQLLSSMEKQFAFMNKKLDSNHSELKTEINQLYSKVSENSAAVAAIRSDTDILKATVTDHNSTISMLEKRISELESKLAVTTTDLRHVEFDRNRYKIRLYGFPGADQPYPTVRSSVIEFLAKSGIEASKISDINIFSTPKDRQIIVSLLSADTADFLCRNSKKIFIDTKIRIARELSRFQRNQMQTTIDSYRKSRPNAKISVDWAAPAAYADRQRIWPVQRSLRRQSTSYASAAATQQVFYDKCPITDLSTVPANTKITAEIDPVAGSRFFGTLVSWDGVGIVSDIVGKISKDRVVPFSLDSRDNVIYAATTTTGGKISFFYDDGGEKGAGTDLLRLMENRRLSGYVIVILRKFGNVRLGPDRYRLFRQLATKLVQQLGPDSTGMDFG